MYKTMNLKTIEEIPSTLGCTRLKVLAILNEKGLMKTAEVAAFCKISPAAATGILDRMEGAGFIERGTDVNDRRVRFVFLTDYGRKLAAKL
jgi:DNA-binding MarR family transcriptional regulator